jgi:predicted porin
MKKSLIALAVISATGSAFAQSSVSIYGIMDGGYNQVTTTTLVPAVNAAPGVYSFSATTGAITQGAATAAAGASAKESKVRTSGGNAAGGWASNRLGFRGTEDLGGGNSANFMYELGMNAGTTGDLAVSGGVRSSWVSLKNNNMGEVTVGRQYNPIFETSVSLDAGRANNVNVGKSLYSQIATTRMSGGIKYTSPNMNGLVVKVITGQNETEQTLPVISPNTTGNTAYGGKFEYTLADLTLVGGYHKTDVKNAAGDRTESLFGGIYSIGMVNLIAGYGDLKVKDAAGVQSAKRNGYQLGVQASLNGKKYNTAGGIDVYATYGDVTVQAASGTAENKMKGYQAGGIYNLSPRTGVYAIYGKATGTLTATAFESKGNEFAMGVRHMF